MIASDDNNPNFVGAHNPDTRLAVRFYKKPVENAFKTQAAGRPIFDEVDFVEIRVPGDPTTAIDTFVRDEHKQRFPMHWARYQNSQGGDGQVSGTPLEQWTRISRAQVEELRAIKFTTVEQIASASDAQLQRIGMIAGMSPHAFREAAQRFLKVASADADVAASDAKVKALEEQNAKQAEMLSQLQAQVAELAKPKKRGPRPKEKLDG